MSTRTILLSFALLTTLAGPLLARERTDVLVMKNGDRMTCEIMGLEGGVLYVKFDYIDGTTSVDWAKVARLESNQLFVVKTENGSVYTGTLRTLQTPADRPVQIQVVQSSEQQITVNNSQVVQMVPTSDNFWQRFNGGVSVGIIYSKGSTSTQYSLGSDIAYLRERWNGRASFNSNLSYSTRANTSTRNSLNLSSLRLLPLNNWFYSGIATFLQSSQQGIPLQTTLGGGIGRYLINTNRASVSVLAGAAWQNTDYTRSIVPISNHNIAAALIYTEASLFKFRKTNLDATTYLLPAISDPGRVRFNVNASYYIRILRDLRWNISFYGNWDNRPPPTFSGSDYGSSSGLSWTFGLR